MGGLIAQEGFDYQVFAGLLRLPGWLANPAFEEILFEGLEDIEVRFFAPQAPRSHVLERLQAKSGMLTPKDVKDVLQSFLNFEQSYPDVARVYTLLTPQFPASLAWLGRQPDRVRRARPFYAPFRDIVDATVASLQATFVEDLGTDLGQFACRGVDFELQPVMTSTQAQAGFHAALNEAFPAASPATYLQVQAAFAALLTHLQNNRRAPVKRSTIFDLLRAATMIDLEPRSLDLHFRSDHTAAAATTALEVDATAFSGAGGFYPEPAVWQEQLVDPLARAAAWHKGRGGRLVSLAGQFRISTGLTIGAAFRSAMGFDILLPTRDGPWPTNAHADSGKTYADWETSQPEALVNGRLVVAVGVIRSPVDAPVAIATADQAQHGVGVVKAAVTAAVARLRPTSIELYFVGPVAFATALGHRWNALPTTQLFVYRADTTKYQPTGVILDSKLMAAPQ